MKRTYKNFLIENEQSHYKVTSENGEVWREDTFEDAKRTIDEIEKDKQ